LEDLKRVNEQVVGPIFNPTKSRLQNGWRMIEHTDMESFGKKRDPRVRVVG
jgi:hypothetical protein